MARYLVDVPHTAEDCTAELDSVVSFSHELFGRFDWGCKADEHVGWAVVEAQDTATVRSLLPMVMRGKARIVSLNKFTLDDVKSFHEHDEPK
jgi:hypothetical protein